jgi:hypothetical protein
MPDFNNADTQRAVGLIDDGTICVVLMNVRRGEAGADGWLKRSKGGTSNALDCEFTVQEGPFAKRKFWGLFTLEGATEGQQKASDISGRTLRAILESARGFRPDDQSDAAKAARRTKDYGEFDGLLFTARVGIEKGKDGFKDKNILQEVITPDRKAWVKVEQSLRTATAVASVGSTFDAKPQSTSAAIVKPKWASG